jgi:UDP-N-acetylmuramate--L-alanine ligase/UDP-N-acetylenolpyruvoylglucosamine reductase
MRAAPLPDLFGRPVRRIHCLGASGMGMAPLALYLSRLGFMVSGEDDAWLPDVAATLAAAGVAAMPCPDACDLVVYSSAIAPTHPSYAAAAAAGRPLARRGEVLAEIVRGRRLVAVCGSHGKTTTTAMLITILRRAGFPAGYILGGLFNDGTPPAAAGSNDWVVAEIDESDGTIAHFAPALTVAVNLDWDHPDHYRRPDDLQAAFAALFARTSGPVLVSDACADSLRLAAGALTFGRTGDYAGAPVAAAASAEPASEGLTLALGGRFGPLEAKVRAWGDFNAANALAALAAADLMGVAPTARALADYPGVRRRQVVLGQAGGVTVIEDYAHHPAEVRALLGGLRRQTRAEGRILAVFQPHRYSRTAQFKREFAAALALADGVYLLDVYAAGEAPVAGGTTADVYAEMKQGSPALPVTYLPGAATDLAGAVAREARAGDCVVFVGAGDIDRQARSWLAGRAAAETAARRWDAWAAALGLQLSPGARLSREEPLATKTTLRVGGAARVYAEPADESDLRMILAAAAAERVPIFMLGRGSNLIVPDAGVEGLVISLARPGWARFERLPDGTVRVGAGLRLKHLCGLAASAGLAGFEFLEGIPGNVGGALRMNAGAMGGWIFDVVVAVRLMTRDGEVRLLPRADLHAGYRECAELREAIAVEAVLRPRAEVGGPDVARQIESYRHRRHESQPREPSAGCIFKNPPDTSAGRLIDACGLKGERIGDAEVSSVHANFIVNRGRATSADVLALIQRVRGQVRQATGVELEPEALLYGREWSELL